MTPASLHRAGNSLLLAIVLAAAVVATSIVIAVPLAWLTARTDLPGRAV